MRTAVYLTFLFAISSAISGCTSIHTVNDADVSEDKLYGSYSATYDARKAVLTLYAQYRVGGSTGTTVRLTSPSSLTADGETMKAVDGDANVLNVSGTYYTIEKNVADASGTHTFVWTRRDGSIRTNVLDLSDVKSISAGQGSGPLSKASGFSVAYTGPEIGAGESVSCTLRSKNKDSDATGEIELKKSVTSGNECIFTAGELATFRAGAAAVLVDRFRTAVTQQGHEAVGGTMRSQYTSAEHELTILP